jgi:hypothetical protein
VRKLQRTDWRPGSVAEPLGPVLVSVTDYTSNHAIDLAGISVAGLRLRRRWPTLPGAVGVWLWTLPKQRRTGSVSVWLNQEALEGFVSLPEHVKIMRRYRDRGSIQVTTWTTEQFDPRATWRAARGLLLDGTPLHPHAQGEPERL